MEWTAEGQQSPVLPVCTEVERPSPTGGSFQCIRSLARGLQIGTGVLRSQNPGSITWGRAIAVYPTRGGSEAQNVLIVCLALGRKPGLSPLVFSSSHL